MLAIYSALIAEALDVAMNDAFGLSGVQSVGDLDGENRFRFQRQVVDFMLERYAVQELHGDGNLALMVADVVRAEAAWASRWKRARA